MFELSEAKLTYDDPGDPDYLGWEYEIITTTQIEIDMIDQEIIRRLQQLHKLPARPITDIH